jgi:very-short-patch-repair endonuclease
MDTKPKFKLARRLRRQMSPPEVRLWLRLRTRSETGFSIRRQHPIGSYVLDFYCPEAHLAIEVDGAQHTSDDAVIYDEKRDAWLLTKGIETLRIPAAYIMNDADSEAQGVIEVIRERIAALKLAE